MLLLHFVNHNGVKISYILSHYFLALWKQKSSLFISISQQLSIPCSLNKYIPKIFFSAIRELLMSSITNILDENFIYSEVSLIFFQGTEQTL